MRSRLKTGPGQVVLKGNQLLDEVVSNTELVVQDGNVTIGFLDDNVSVTTQLSGQTVYPLDMLIGQAIGDVTLNSGGSLTVKSPMTQRAVLNAATNITVFDVADTSTATTTNGYIIAACVGNCVTLSASNYIKVAAIGSDCVLTSTADVISANLVGNNSILTASKCVNVIGYVGAGSYLNSLTSTVNCGMLYTGVTVMAQLDVVCRGVVGVNATVRSKTGCVTLMNAVMDGASIEASLGISAPCGIGVAASLRSDTGAIKVVGGTQAQANLLAQLGVTVTGCVGAQAQITSRTGSVSVVGNIGTEVVVEAVTSIICKGDIHDGAKLSCPNGVIQVTGNVSQTASLIAAKVYINGVLQPQPSVNPINAAPLRFFAKSSNNNRSVEPVTDSSPKLSLH